ncbi:uncharacterized protein LOC104453530 [Eucalyptus grandis]|uniref:uncharacterized protein LOC104453530 n=1 Tax=Eucalyptus grandis TaxID=71139 RepID=UPI0005252A52|nr:uncharacterized protein LOC104453530 [Eucalyptus grandis]
MACTIDFRTLDEGFGGKTYKRKRAAAASAAADDGATMEIDGAGPPPSKRAAIPSLEDPDRPTTASTFSFGRPTYDGVIAGRVSGRKWKQPRRQRASAQRASVKGTGFEERGRQKEIKRAYRERMAELKETIRANKVEKRRKREEREKKKKENILRTGTKLQKITNPKTLKKLAKSKQRKLLKVVPDELVKK